MLNSILTLFAILGGIGVVVTLIVGIRSLFRRPQIRFNLFDRAKITLYNESTTQRLFIISAPIANTKKGFFGDSAKKTIGMIHYRAPTEEENDFVGLNTAISLPWLNNYSQKIKVSGKLDTEEEIREALEKTLFDRTENNIPQGMGNHLAVAYTIEKTNKMFLASNPPIQIEFPKYKKNRTQFAMCSLRLSIAGENIPSTISKGTFIMANRWDNFTVPEKIVTEKTPSKIRNFLLRLGIGKNQEILGND